MALRLRSPAEFYIKALLVHPNGYSNEAIAEILEEQRRPYFTLNFIERMRLKMHPPDPFYPYDKKHLPSYNYIRRQRINNIFQTTLPMKMAFEILDFAKAIEFVEGMLLVNAPHLAIAQHITRWCGVYSIPEAIRLYKHYFFNTDLSTTTETRIGVQLDFDHSADKIPELEFRKGFLRSPYFKDPKKIAADLPHSPTTAILVQERLGTPPSKHDLSLRVMELRNISVLRGLEAAHQDAPGDSQRCLNYTNTARIAIDIMEVTKDPGDELSEQLQSIALRTDTQPLKHVKQLSAGQHTVDLAPLRDPANEQPTADTHPGHKDG
jgi:hypothetical protein